MSEFHDPELRQQLGRMSGPYPDDNAAFAAWQRRVGQARRRRAVAWISGAAMSLVMITVGVSALQNPARHSLVPSSRTSADATVNIATTEADDSTIASTAPETTAPTTSATDSTPSTEGTIETSVPETEATDASGSGSGPGPNSGKSGPDGSTTPTQTPAPQAATKPFNSVGGNITVRQNGDQLTVIAINPAAGFQAEQNDHSGDQVTVIFKSANHQSEISVKLSDGVMSPRISEQDDSHGESGPGGSSGGDHGGGGNS